MKVLANVNEIAIAVNSCSLPTGLIIDNINYYFKLPLQFFVGFSQLKKYIYWITLPFLIIGVIKNFKKELASVPESEYDCNFRVETYLLSVDFDLDSILEILQEQENG